MFQEGLVKHSTPLTRQYFFKNENAADRITLLGVYINVVLSVVKFCGGLMFNSAVLVADAGHSLSDLFSDFITLWAVQVRSCLAFCCAIVMASPDAFPRHGPIAT